MIAGPSTDWSAVNMTIAAIAITPKNPTNLSCHVALLNPNHHNRIRTPISIGPIIETTNTAMESESETAGINLVRNKPSIDKSRMNTGQTRRCLYLRIGFSVAETMRSVLNLILHGFELILSLHARR
jgi:hypothetical protein